MTETVIVRMCIWQAKLHDVRGDYEEKIDSRLRALQLRAAPYKEPEDLLEKVMKILEQVGFAYCITKFSFGACPIHEQ